MKKTMIGAALALSLTAMPALSQEVGVASCDAFLKTFDTCIAAKAQPAQKDALTKAFAAVKGNWLEVAKTADGKKSLDPVCKQTADQMKQQLASLQCAW